MSIVDPPEPAETDEARTAEAGEASRPSPGTQELSEERPDYDERQDRISEERKPAGPPLPESDEEAPRELAAPAEDEPPVDPED